MGLIIDETLSWNQHIDHVTTKLCSACYALRNLKYFVPQSTLRTIYYAYIHSILSYGLIFWGRSSNAKKLFILQKKIVRIITSTGIRESCRKAFKNMQIMTLYSQYIFSLILFTVKNKHLFTLNHSGYSRGPRDCAVSASTFSLPLFLANSSAPDRFLGVGVGVVPRLPRGYYIF